MSFFDDDDEYEEPQTRASTAARPARSGGARRRPPSGHQQAVQTRRTVAVVVIVVVVILAALLIHSCQASNTTNSLKDYNNSVSGLIDRSDATGQSLVRTLASGQGAGTVSQNVNNLHADAVNQLKEAEGLSVPGQMSQAQQNLVLALSMRSDGIKDIAASVNTALNTTGASAKAAVTTIATAMAKFLASDVVYKAYAVPEIARALHGDGIAVGGASGVTINGGQFLTDLAWLNPNSVSTKIGAKLPSTQGATNGTCASVCGHTLNSVSVGSTTLSTTATNTLPAHPAPTFTLSVTNGGDSNEYNVGCKVTVVGASDSGSSTINETTPGQTSDCSVSLKSAPSAGTYQVKAEVLPVPGEKNTANNSQTFTVSFQ